MSLFESTLGLPDEAFASRRYSKRKRTPVNYVLDDLFISDSESEFESPVWKKSKIRTTSGPFPKQKIFPFMELPAEIRNMIYSYALTDSSGINFVAVHKHRRRTTERVSKDLMSQHMGSHWAYGGVRANDKPCDEHGEPNVLAASLLAVSRQIYHETRDILYSNEFRFLDSIALYSFLINLGPVNAKYLKTIRLLGWGYGRGTQGYNHACFSVLVWATNITAFHIDARLGWHRATCRGAQQFYRNAFPWLEAFGTAKGRADAAVDVLQFSEDWLDGIPHSQSLKQKIDAFKAMLSSLLNAQQKRLTAKAPRKRKVSKKF